MSDLLHRLRTANAIEARTIWKEARERGVTDALERAYAFGITANQTEKLIVAERSLSCARESLDDLNESALLYVTEVNYLLGVLERIKKIGRPSGWPSDLWNEVCEPRLPAV